MFIAFANPPDVSQKDPKRSDLINGAYFTSLSHSRGEIYMVTYIYGLVSIEKGRLSYKLFQVLKFMMQEAAHFEPATLDGEPIEGRIKVYFHSVSTDTTSIGTVFIY